jgi:citronellol/citronellal dehydrogenase
MGKKCLKHIKNSTHPSVLVIAPPIEMLNNDDWWINHLYYSMSKFNMSIMAKFWNKEFPNISVNTLWPRTTIATAPVQNLLGGTEMMNISRKTDIMGDAAEIILKANPKLCTGKNFIDDEVIASSDIDVEKYRYNNYKKEKDLMPDFFC